VPLLPRPSTVGSLATKTLLECTVAMGPRPPTEPRPFLLALFSGVRGIGILGSSL
jgi:hypothetical protein